MALIKLSVTERRRLSAFFTCLVLAFFAWVIAVLSNPKPYTVRAVLDFRNTPQKRAFHSLQSDTITVSVNGNGWDALFSRMAGGKPITVDLHTLENKSYVVLKEQKDQINSRRESDQQIISFTPDTLYFDFSNRKVKRIPVNLISSIKYRQQFFQSGNITLNPAYVIINGPSNLIDGINSWNSDTLKMDSVDESVNTHVNLEPVREGNLSIYPKNIQANIPVDEFTEKVLQIPVKLINNLDDDDVKIFPQKVKITFITSLTRYTDIDEDMFEATADLDLWRKNGYRILPVVISKVPDYCHIVKIEPRNIDFIVKK
jgi:YbbR domain-containing protein